MSQLRANGWLGRQDDARLATLVGRGDAAAFEALYDRHHASLLAFCRHMLGNREDGEEALQQTFLRAHRALSAGRPPDMVRPWLFAIARNRCRTMLAARRDAAMPAELPERGFDDLAEQVRRRAELRELVADLGRLPEEQREALVMAELADLSHTEIGAALGCAPQKVKALVFQAREALVADRDARCIPCTQIRGLLETATGGVLRRASLRRHLRQCAPCDAYRLAVSGRRGGLGALLPVAPTAGLKGAVLGAAGLWGGGESASAAVAMAGAASAAGSGSAAVAGSGSAAVAGLTFKAVVAKVAVTAAVAGAGVSGGLAVAEDPAPQRPPEAAARVERATPVSTKPRAERARPAAVTETPVSSPLRQPRAARPRAVAGRRLLRRARRQARAARRARRLQARRPRAARRALRLQAGRPPRAVLRARRRAATAPSRPALRLRARRRARVRLRPPALPAPTAQPTPTPTPEVAPVATAPPTEPTPTPEATPAATAPPGP